MLLPPERVGENERSGMDEQSLGIEQTATDDAGTRGGRRGAQLLQPVGIAEPQVVVEEDDVRIGRRGRDAGIVAAHEADILGEPEHAQPVGVLGEACGRLVGRAVVDDDDLCIGEPGPPQGGQGALGQVPAVPGEDDKRGLARRRRPGDGRRRRCAGFSRHGAGPRRSRPRVNKARRRRWCARTPWTSRLTARPSLRLPTLAGQAPRRAAVA